MTYKRIKWMILLLPTLITGLWEYVRHQFLLDVVSMEAGNVLTPVIVFAVSAVLLFPLFTRLERIQQELQAERAQKAAFEAQDHLARKLHDGIAQSLFLLAVKVDRLEYTTDRVKQENEVQALRKTVYEVNHYVRQAISNLRDARNQDTDMLLEETLEERIRHLTAEAQIPYQLDWRMAEDLLTSREKIELLACIREAVVNIQKHAGATAGRIEAQGTGDGWQVRIIDNGVGIARERLTAKDSYGLRMMQERGTEMNWTIMLRTEDRQTVLSIINKEEGGSA
jgi:two-component system nitrate/nitrite sensor histidine kinase NarQ